MTNLLRGLFFYNDIQGSSNFIPALNISKLTKALNTKFVLDEEALNDVLYTMVANYDIKSKACWLRLESAEKAGVSLTWGFADVVSVDGIPAEKIEQAFKLWKTASCTPEQACVKLGLTMEELMTLAHTFDSLNVE